MEELSTARNDLIAAEAAIQQLCEQVIVVLCCSALRAGAPATVLSLCCGLHSTSDTLACNAGDPSVSLRLNQGSMRASCVTWICHRLTL